MQDAGIYKLVASNAYGQCTSSCKVFVREDLTDQDDTVIDNMHFRSGKPGHRGFSPTLPPRNLNLNLSNRGEFRNIYN